MHSAFTDLVYVSASAIEERQRHWCGNELSTTYSAFPAALTTLPCNFVFATIQQHLAWQKDDLFKSSIAFASLPLNPLQTVGRALRSFDSSDYTWLCGMKSMIRLRHSLKIYIIQSNIIM